MVESVNSIAGNKQKFCCSATFVKQDKDVKSSLFCSDNMNNFNKSNKSVDVNSFASTTSALPEVTSNKNVFVASSVTNLISALVGKNEENDILSYVKNVSESEIEESEVDENDKTNENDETNKAEEKDDSKTLNEPTAEVINSDNIAEVLAVEEYDMLERSGYLASVISSAKSQYKDGTIVCTDKNGNVTKVIWVGQDFLIQNEYDPYKEREFGGEKISREALGMEAGPGACFRDLVIYGLPFCTHSEDGHYNPDQLNDNLRKMGFDI